MTMQTVKEVSHEIVVDAPADAVYALIADVRAWPQIFPPTIYVDQLEHGPDTERIRIWATANGEVKNWTSRRVLNPGALSIAFRQEISAPPVAAMGGTWLIQELSPSSCLVMLLHDYRAVDDAPDALAWIDAAVDRNSRAELGALKQNVERAHEAAALTFSFTDSVPVEGSVSDAYDFINEAGRWAERLPHVASVRLEEDVAGLQVLEMDTRAKDGSVHTTKSYRVCVPNQRIAYKQVTLPALMDLHTGMWTFTPQEAGVLVSSQHTVVLRAENIEPILGPGAGVAEARAYVRTALSTNSTATLNHARDHAQNRR